MFITERCTINRLQETDYSNVEKIYANQEVRKFLGGIRNEDSMRGISKRCLPPVKTPFIGQSGRSKQKR